MKKIIVTIICYFLFSCFSFGQSNSDNNMCHVDVSQLHESEVRKLTNPYHFGIVCNHNESDSETIWQKIYEKSKVAVNSVAQYDDTNTSDYFFVFRLKINNIPNGIIDICK